MASNIESSLIDTLSRDFNRMKRQKSRRNGGVEARVLQNLGMVLDEQYLGYANTKLFNLPREANKLYLTFNLIGPRLGKLLGRLSSINPTFKARPNRQDPKAFAEAEVVDRLIVALDDKLVQPSRTWELLWWMAVGGVAFEYIPWVPNATLEPVTQFDESGELLYTNTNTGEHVPESMMQEMLQVGAALPESFEIYEEIAPVGDVGSEILGPFNVFVDQSVRSIADLAPDQRVMVAKIRTLGWIEENFGVTVEPGKDLSIISSGFADGTDTQGGSFLRDLIPLIQGGVSEEDPPMALVVESFSPISSKNPRGRYECFIPGKEILHSDESPYGDIPLVDYHWKAVTTTFWTPGYVEALIPPQKFINKRLSQLGEQSNATLYSSLLLGGALTEADFPADFPAVIKNAITDSGAPMVQRTPPPEFPSWFLESIKIVVQMFNDIAGGSDLFEESKFPGQLRGPLAVPMLQEIIDTEWGPLYNHIGERMARSKQMRLDRVKQFYPPVRTMHYTDKDQKNEVLVFHADQVLRGGLNFNIKVERGELLPELRSLREARIKDRLSGPLSILYLDERTGRFDKSKIAADLKFGDAGRESREARYRKLGMEVVEMLWKGQPLPPVLPFYDHTAMLDELEAAMSTLEFHQASPQIQQMFIQRYEQHRQYLIQEAQAQQQAMMASASQNAVAQATQQAAAMAAADAVHSANNQLQAQRGQPTEQFVHSANEQAEAKRGQPAPRKRTLTVKEEG